MRFAAKQKRRRPGIAPALGLRRWECQVFASALSAPYRFFKNRKLVADSQPKRRIDEEK